MLQPTPVVINDASHVRHELHALGLTNEIVTTVARKAAAAKAEALAIDPFNSPGLLAYIFGVRAVRTELIALGWRMSRAGNVESTVNDELGIQICFQNVDTACTDRPPKPSRAKALARASLSRRARPSFSTEPRLRP